MLLQQILRAMEEPKASTGDAVIFSIVALMVRLVATQVSVLKSWYSRRSYERSRGEMITMIFEKTLARKVMSAPRLSKPEEHAIGDADSLSNLTKKSSFHPYTLWSKVYVQMRGIFRSKSASVEIREPASMGKILNLMRYAPQLIWIPLGG